MPEEKVGLRARCKKQFSKKLKRLASLLPKVKVRARRHSCRATWKDCAPGRIEESPIGAPSKSVDPEEISACSGNLQ